MPDTSFINRMLFGDQNAEEYIDKPWSTKQTPISVKKFNEEHARKYNAHQLRKRQQQEQEEKYRDFPKSQQEQVPLARFKEVQPVVQPKPAYLTSMTDADAAELVKEKHVFTLKQIEDFFESKVNQKICFEGIPVTVLEVFPRSEGVAVKFFIRKTDIGQLTLIRSMNEQKKQRPVALVDIDGSGQTRLFGEIQGAINENFKVLFK